MLRKIIEEYNLKEILGGYFEQRELGLFLDLAVYSIIAENNAAQYYPDYTYNHPLFTNGMRQYSDSTVSDFLNSVTDDQSIGFLNSWNETRNHREKIYISYDSTNKNCQAGDIEMVEFGHPKVDVGQPVFNYAVAYATAVLKELLDKRDAIRKDEILSAIVKSGRSYEEIMGFLNVEETEGKTEE